LTIIAMVAFCRLFCARSALQINKQTLIKILKVQAV
jgi:hypothetical protein